MAVFRNALVAVAAVVCFALMIPLVATMSVALLLAALAVLWMAGIHVLLTRSLRRSESDLFPLADQFRNMPNEQAQ